MNTDENTEEYQFQKARNIAGLIFWINDNALNYEINEKLIKWIHREVMKGQLRVEAVGEYRKCSVSLKHSVHIPPDFNEVPNLVTQMITAFRMLNANNHGVTIKMAYMLWAFNWIHPFENGNGRTARLLAHYILVRSTGSRNLGMHLEDYLKSRREEYFQALKNADTSFDETGEVNLSDLDQLVANFLDRITSG